MPLSERTERALESCYDAVYAPERWSYALQSLGESLGAESCTFYFPDDPSASVPVSSGHEEFAELWLRNEPHAPDPHIERAMPSLWPGWSWLIEDQVSTEGERKTLLYYQETARPGNREWWGGTSFSVGGRICCLPLYRSACRGPFTHVDGRRFSEVGPALAKVVRLAEKFASFGAASTLSVLERVGCAAIVIDGSARMTDLKCSAENLLGEHLDAMRGRVALRDRASNISLQRLLSMAVREERTRFGSRSPVVSHPPVLINRDKSPWLLVEAMPLTAFGSDLFSSGRAVLLLTDLTLEPRPDVTYLRVAFGLTAAEARLAAFLGSGSGIEFAATSIGISRETARTHLKAVFVKTGVHRQAELAALLNRLRIVQS